jgi:hypothetical protein
MFNNRRFAITAAAVGEKSAVSHLAAPAATHSSKNGSLKNLRDRTFRHH